ncbi:hypothetical protein Ga0074812_101275 [Parafrankia irregularis]|uniref:Uncharacterized protein n=1 Tax=Parafrankia irregularis TaxID=795642 RepID=A0A0S4QE87_9ACTN|nr:MULTISPECIES: hypothetical protein [Parafrankia]MBE3199558.1 hypothetical protein [Parafrankia sp. CH37]CUU53777.1 hypothetical protein Ga0074812_101275 [Parafrankia irregularis]
MTRRLVIERSGFLGSLATRHTMAAGHEVTALGSGVSWHDLDDAVRSEQITQPTEGKAFSTDDAVRGLGFASRPHATGIRHEAALCRLQKAVMRRRTGT